MGTQHHPDEQRSERYSELWEADNAAHQLAVFELNDARQRRKLVATQMLQACDEAGISSELVRQFSQSVFQHGYAWAQHCASEAAIIARYGTPEAPQ